MHIQLAKHYYTKILHRKTFLNLYCFHLLTALPLKGSHEGKEGNPVAELNYPLPRLYSSDTKIDILHLPSVAQFKVYFEIFEPLSMLLCIVSGTNSRMQCLIYKFWTYPCRRNQNLQITYSLTTFGRAHKVIR